MVVQLTQNLVWILISGEWMNGLSKTIWMDLNGSTACYQHCSNGITMCVQNQWACLKVEILNGFKWSVSRRVNEPVIFSHFAHLLGHWFHALVKICSDRDDIVPLRDTFQFYWLICAVWLTGWIGVLAQNTIFKPYNTNKKLRQRTMARKRIHEEIEGLLNTINPKFNYKVESQSLALFTCSYCW